MFVCLFVCLLHFSRSNTNARARTIYERWMEWEFGPRQPFKLGPPVHSAKKAALVRKEDFDEWDEVDYFHQFSKSKTSGLQVFRIYFCPRPDDNPWLQYVKFEERPVLFVACASS